MRILQAHRVNVSGNLDGTPIVFIHGFGCGQTMWRFIAPAFEADHKVVLFDLLGSGRSDLSQYDRGKYETLDGHATDVLEICKALGLNGVTLVGHSVSSMIAAIAANRDPDLIGSVVMVGPSPSYIDDKDYVGGFKREDVEGLLQMLESNYLGWASQMAPAIMGTANSADLGDELTESFCRTDPDIAAHFARTTFLSDHREDTKVVRQHCLLLQCSDDIIAPLEVGSWLEKNMQKGHLVVMQATGHCPHMSAPAETIAAIKCFMAEIA